MQWLRQKRGEDPAAFWRETEAKRGGPIGFSTFATFVGGSRAGAMELTGLLYVVNDQAWFEDFERDNWLARIVAGNRKFEKTEFSFDLAEVVSARIVTLSAARLGIAKALPAERVNPASALARVFGTPVVHLALRDGSSLYFDVIRRRELLGLFSRAPS